MTFDAVGRTYTVNSVSKTYEELSSAISSGKAVIICTNVSVVANGTVVDRYSRPYNLDGGTRSLSSTAVQWSYNAPNQLEVYLLVWESTDNLPTLVAAIKNFAS